MADITHVGSKEHPNFPQFISISLKFSSIILKKLL